MSREGGPSVVMLLAVIGAWGLTGCRDAASDRAVDDARRAKAAVEEQAKATARGERDAALERARLATLWTYSQVPAGRGQQVASSIKSTNDVDTDGKGARSVLLVFRDHPVWGRSSYLVLTAGDFRCSPRCTVSVRIDDAAPKAVAAHRPKTDEAIALFIDDARGLWKGMMEAKRLSVEFPVKAGGTRSATYDVAGLDRSKMPGWDGAPANR